MATVTPLRQSDGHRVPWSNGRGVTVELALWPPHADFARQDFAWRISKATIDRDGAFSAFPGVERVLTVLAGAGIVLRHDNPGERGARVRLRELEPYRFRGDWPAEAELVGASVEALNVFVRDGCGRAVVEILRLGERRLRAELETGHALLHVVAGEVRARVSGEEDSCELESEESLLIHDATPVDELDVSGLEPGTIALLARIK